MLHSLIEIVAIRHEMYLLFVLMMHAGDCHGDLQKRILLKDGDSYYDIINTLNNLTREVQTLKKETELLRHKPVFFVAYLSKSVPGQNHQIIFDDVRLNIGNAYHVSHGNFIAPANGTYQFTITACSFDNHYTVLELTVNAKVVDKVLAGDDAYSDCNTGVFLHRLAAGDDVYVQHEAQGDYILSHIPYGRPSFTGVFLHAM